MRVVQHRRCSQQAPHRGASRRPSRRGAPVAQPSQRPRRTPAAHEPPAFLTAGDDAERRDVLDARRSTCWLALQRRFCGRRASTTSGEEEMLGREECESMERLIEGDRTPKHPHQTTAERRAKPPTRQPRTPRRADIRKITPSSPRPDRASCRVPAPSVVKSGCPMMKPATERRCGPAGGGWKTVTAEACPSNGESVLDEIDGMRPAVLARSVGNATGPEPQSLPAVSDQY